MGPWNPWQDLRGRPEVLFAVAPLPGRVAGAYLRWAGHRLVVVAAGLSRAERNAALAHELVHDELGGGAGYDGQPSSWAAVVAREERRVDDEVACRLVPLDDLRRMCQAADTLGEPLTANEVAAAFDVPEQVAGRALELAAGR